MLAHPDDGRGLQVLSLIMQDRGDVKGAERALRDYYVGVVRSRDFASASLAVSARRAFQLCAKTLEFGLLKTLTAEIEEQMREANDQTVYVDVAC